MTTSTKHFKYDENTGDIEVEYSGEELLPGRADIDMSDRTKTFRGESGSQLGGMKPPLEKQLKQHKKQLGWEEPHHKAIDILHVCPVCQTKYWGRPNKIYCSKRCKDVAGQRLQRAKQKQTFKPHYGIAGEVYFKTKEGIVSFIPAFNAESMEKAHKFLVSHYEGKEEIEDYTKQVKEVIK